MNKEFETGEFVIGKKPKQNANQTDSYNIMSAAGNNEKPTESDEYILGNGFEIASVPENDMNSKASSKKNFKAGKKGKKPKGVLRTIIWVICIIAVSAGIAIGAILCVIDYMGLGSSKTVTVTIENGETLDSIANELKDCGAIKFPFLFKFYSDKKGYYEKFTEGAHTFKTDAGYSGIIYEFTNVPGYTVETVKVTIPEKATIDEIAILLEEKKICSQDDFFDAEENSTFDFDFINEIPLKTVHYRLEGYLFPDTYEFYVWNSKAGAEFAINKMLSNFSAKFTDEDKATAKKMGYSIHEILTLSSIIELECSGFYDEMPNVAAVFYNRLENWGDEPKMLGSSPTAEYPYGSGNYDTNKIEGLPPGPLCAPGAEAIKAALNPTKRMNKKYFYFVTDTDFKFYYGKTLNEHNSIIAGLRAKGKWGED